MTAHPSPRPVTRTAGLPVAVLDRLRFDDSFRLAAEIAAMRVRLTEQGAALAKALYPVIGAAGAEKPRLVGLRRALYQVRPPKEWDEQLADVLPHPTARRIARWTSELALLGRYEELLPAITAEETRTKQGVLHELAQDPRFRRALSQARPELFAELRRWRRPRRRTLVRLTRYLVRAATKTSPFSTFTISGTSAWDGPPAETPGVAGVMELSGVLLDRLVRGLGDVPAPRLRANASATPYDGGIGFLGAPPGESIRTVPDSPAVRACLAILDESGPHTPESLAARLGPDSAGAERFVARLREAGLIEAVPPVPDQSADPLGDLLAWLRAANAPEYAALVVPLERLRLELLRTVPVDDVDGQVERQRALENACADLAVRFGVPEDAATSRTKDLVHENAVFTGPATALPLARWLPALDDLDAVRHWLAALDSGLPLRLALGAFCGERFGPGARLPFLAFHRAVQETGADGDSADRRRAARAVAELLREWPVPGRAPLADSGLDRLRVLAGLRDEARNAVLAAPERDGTIRVDPATVRELAARRPVWVIPVPSLGAYVQTAGEGESFRLVLNVAQRGHGRGRTRVEHLVRLATGTGPAGTWSAEPAGGPVLAEIGGTFGSALNRRAPSAPFEITYPFVRSSRPPEQQIELRDLEVRHDAGTDLVRLFSTRLGREVEPVHLGMMADALLPPAARLLVQAFGHTTYVHPGLPILADAGEAAPPDEIVRLPRVEIGRVVIRRARWAVPTAGIPVRPNGGTDAEHLVRLVGWLHEHGLPSRCFVRAAPGHGSGAARTWFLDRSRKPVYMDFANLFLVLGLERMLASAGPVVFFEEALPAPGENGHEHVTEHLVEITGTGARHD